MFDFDALLIECGKHILNDAEWPSTSTKLNVQGFSVELGKTPRGTFRTISFDCQNGHRIILIQSNPEKVVDPDNKVMVYDENGGVKLRTGQVRRKKDNYSFSWF